MKRSTRPWDTHYNRDRSALLYPDENLLRMLRKHLQTLPHTTGLIAADLGCGSGRHIMLLENLGIESVIGIDISHEALRLCKDAGIPYLCRADNEHLPLKSDSFDVVITWGSLHYGPKEDLPVMLDEIVRILKKGGQLFGTLRTERDTYMKQGKHLGNDVWITNLDDIENSTVSFYSETELQSALNVFKECQYGLMERTLVGDIQSRISHWMFRAEK